MMNSVAMDLGNNIDDLSFLLDMTGVCQEQPVQQQQQQLQQQQQQQEQHLPEYHVMEPLSVCSSQQDGCVFSPEATKCTSPVASVWEQSLPSMATFLEAGTAVSEGKDPFANFVLSLPEDYPASVESQFSDNIVNWGDICTNSDYSRSDYSPKASPDSGIPSSPGSSISEEDEIPPPTTAAFTQKRPKQAKSSQTDKKKRRKSRRPMARPIEKQTPPVKKDKITIWLAKILSSPYHQDVMKWIDKDKRTFRILDQVELGRLWGEAKDNPRMSYDNLSRAMRYYYKREELIMCSQKLIYQFGSRAIIPN